MKNLKFTQTRRLLFNFFIASAVLLITYSCSESDNALESPNVVPYKCDSCKEFPVAKVENDNSYKGIYLGVTPTGNISVDVMNSDSKLTAVWTIDGVKINLIAKNIVPDKKNIYYASFSGVYNGSLISFDFNVKADGSSPKVVSTSYAELGDINKEKSKLLLEVFEGKYTMRVNPPIEIETDARVIDTLGNISYISGKFNLVVYRSGDNVFYKSDAASNSWWKGVIELNGKSYRYTGTINESHQLIGNDNFVYGKLNVDEISGPITNILFNNASFRSFRVL